MVSVGNPNMSELGKKYGGRTLGAKNKSTILKEKAREAFEKEQLEDWVGLSKLANREAMKAKNRQERQYVIDQVIGRPTETKKIEIDVEFDLDV